MQKSLKAQEAKEGGKEAREHKEAEGEGGGGDEEEKEG